MKQLNLPEFNTQIKIKSEDSIDLSEGVIFFGDKGQRVKDLNRTSEFLLSVPKGKYTLYKTGASHILPKYKNRNVFPYLINNYKNCVVKPNFSRAVYPCYTIDNDVKSKRIYCHRIFAMAFIKNAIPHIQYNADHINEDKLDYSIKNLTWVSTSENMKSIKNTAYKKQRHYKIYSSENYI